MAIQEPPVVWDLSDLYSGLQDPALDADYRRLTERASDFEQRYRGRIAAADCTAETLRRALDEYEEINRQRAKPLAYASLMFSADTSDPARGALLQRMQVQSTAISTHLIFFDLEIGRMPEATCARLLQDPLLAHYRH